MKFKNQDEARAWDLYMTAGMTKSGAVVASVLHDADAMLEERRKREDHSRCGDCGASYGHASGCRQLRDSP